MKDQLRLLEEVQRHDARIQELDTALKALPEKLASMQADLAKVTALLDAEKKQLADAEKFRRDLELQLKGDESAIMKAKAKLSQSKSGKDYMAAQREVEAQRKMAGEREDEVLKLAEAIEGYRKRIELHEKDVAELRAVVDREEAEVNERLGGARAEIETARAAREVVAARVEKNLLKKYSSIRMTRGLAIVPVVSGTCRGCHMSIPPQLFIQLQRANTVEQCPSCKRLVYWSELFKNDENKLDQGERADG